MQGEDTAAVYPMFNVCHAAATARPYLGRFEHA
jgi:hypothetical protein